MSDQTDYKELEEQINTMLGHQIDQILSSGKWEEHLKIEISQVLNRRLSLALNEIDINSVIESSINKVTVISRQHAADIYPGIQDNSESRQIAIMTGVVVIENDFVTKNLEVVEDTKLNDTVIFGDLEVKGKIKTNSAAWKDLTDKVDDSWITDIKNSVVETLRRENPLKNAALENAAPGTKLDANLVELLDRGISAVMSEEIPRILENKEWEEQIEILLAQVINRKVTVHLQEIDFAEIIKQHINDAMDACRQHAADVYPGIQDNSDSRQIAIMTGVVVIENDFVTKNLEVVEDTKLNDTVIFGDLEVKGKIKTSSAAWKDLTDKVDDFIKNQLPTTWITDIKNSVVETLRRENPLKNAAPGTKLDANLVELLDRGISAVMSEEIPRILGNNAWEEQIEILLAQVINRKVTVHLQEIDFAEIIKQHINDAMDTCRQSIRNIYPGIDDKSSQKQLTLLPDAVVVENDFVTKNLEVVEKAKFNDIEITGRILSDSPSWETLKIDIASKAREYVDTAWHSRLKSELLQDIKNQGVDVNGVSVNGEKIIDGNTLSPKIENSSLRKVGILENLKVTGQSNIAGVSMFHNRLGINTENPEMALSVWDEEVSIVAGKKEKNQAFIGTNRPQKIGIGVNGESYLDIDIDGTVTLKKLKVGRNQIGFANEVPGWSGAKGDIVFNTNYAPDFPFAWVCLGTFKWSALKNQ